MHNLWATASLLLLSAPVLADQVNRDPMKPDDQAPQPTVSLRIDYAVSAIFTTNGQRVAIVNDRPVRVGELVGSARVLSIQETHVELRTARGDLEVQLNTTKEKK